MPEPDFLKMLRDAYSPSHAYSQLLDAQAATRRQREDYRRAHTPLNTAREGWHTDQFAAAVLHGAKEAGFASKLVLQPALAPVGFIQDVTIITISLTVLAAGLVPSLTVGALLGMVLGPWAELGVSAAVAVCAGCVMGAFTLTMSGPSCLGVFVAKLGMMSIAMVMGALGGAIAYACGSTHSMPAQFDTQASPTT